jgi:predicted metal-dependent HD superfamily phosphohydrolase
MTPAFTKLRFDTLWRELGLTTPSAPVFDALQRAYAEPHRAYHTAQHIDECLMQLDRAGGNAEVELALWFHDAVYDTRAHDNELRSAEWAVRELGADHRSAAHIRDLILMTRHDALPVTPDAQLLVDIDLSILGAPHERFLEYESQVRQEYAWVPETIFRRERAKILQAFLDRPSIYSTALFRELLETRARENIATSLLVQN